jgi:hypothetical protein
VAVVLPAANTTEAGTVRAGLLADSVTVAPPLGAADETATVQVELEPETTLVGAHSRPEMVGSGGVTVTIAVPEAELSPAVMVTA